MNQGWLSSYKSIVYILSSVYLPSIVYISSIGYLPSIVYLSSIVYISSILYISPIVCMLCIVYKPSFKYLSSIIHSFWPIQHTPNVFFCWAIIHDIIMRAYICGKLGTISRWYSKINKAMHIAKELIRRASVIVLLLASEKERSAVVMMVLKMVLKIAGSQTLCCR